MRQLLVLSPSLLSGCLLGFAENRDLAACHLVAARDDGLDLGSATGEVATGDTRDDDSVPAVERLGGCEDMGTGHLYAWTAPATGTWSFDTQGSAVDTVIMITNRAEERCACIDHLPAAPEQWAEHVVQALDGEQLLVVVGAADEDGAYTLNITRVDADTG